MSFCAICIKIKQSEYWVLPTLDIMQSVIKTRKKKLSISKIFLWSGIIQIVYISSLGNK